MKYSSMSTSDFLIIMTLKSCLTNMQQIHISEMTFK